jgi:hypothetical protein
VEVSGQFHTPATLCLGKSLKYPLDTRLGGPHSQSGWYGEVTILGSTGTSNPYPCRPACSQLLYRLCNRGSKLPDSRVLIVPYHAEDIIFLYSINITAWNMFQQKLGGIKWYQWLGSMLNDWGITNQFLAGVHASYPVDTEYSFSRSKVVRA